MKFEQIVKLKLNNFEITPPDIVDKEKEAKKKAMNPVNLADYPWDQCIADQMERYGDEEIAKKVCGAIKAMYGSKEEMDITPNPCWEGYEPIGLKPDGSPNCVPVKASKEKMAIKKEGFPVPSPEGSEDQNAFIQRCMHEIGNEYEQQQALGICYSQWEKK